jgi:hypothetical protein
MRSTVVVEQRDEIGLGKTPFGLDKDLARNKSLFLRRSIRGDSESEQ